MAQQALPNVDINSLVEPTSPRRSPGNASATSRTSTDSRGRDDTTGSARASSVTTTSTPAALPQIAAEVAQPQTHPYYTPMLAAQHHAPYGTVLPPAQYPSMNAYPPFQTMPGLHSRLQPPLPIPLATGSSNKRLAPPQPHPAESPAKKKQSKWTADEDASIIELRGNGMKWEDISKHLPGRSAISCRLRFQNYLERRSEWDEEKKNKLARLYERFKKDMWEKIAKEMQLPWRAAEAMHWQIGEIEMAQRANVPVFHLAGQQSTQAGAAPERGGSISPASALALQPTLPYPQPHSNSLPQITTAHSLPVSPIETGRRSNSNSSVSPPGITVQPRRRADSARAVPTAPSTVNRIFLPPVGELTGSSAPLRYDLPPVITSPDATRR